MVLSIRGSPPTSMSALGVERLMGTMRIPNPAARMTALRGDLCLISCLPFSVSCPCLSISPSAASCLRDLFTTPTLRPVEEARILWLMKVSKYSFSRISSSYVFMNYLLCYFVNIKSLYKGMKIHPLI